MEFADVIKTRYSVRQFSAKEVEKEKLTMILEAGGLAPTACNFRPQRILVLNEKDSLEKLKNCTRFHFDAPLAVIVCYDKETSWKRKYDDADGGEIDASIVTTLMMLKITDLGLGTTWVGSFDPQKVKENFNLGSNLVPTAILPIGYPSEDSQPVPGHFSRKELKETVTYNSF